jgi:hypothetical protein
MKVVNDIYIWNYSVFILIKKICFLNLIVFIDDVSIDNWFKLGEGSGIL